MMDANAPTRIRAFGSPRNHQLEMLAKLAIRATLGRTLGMQASSPWFVYILRCRDRSLYTGIARDVAARIAAHETGRGAKYTRGRGPFVLCAKRRCGTQGDALRLEYAIKQLSRADKEKLTRQPRLASFARSLLRSSVAEP